MYILSCGLQQNVLLVAKLNSENISEDIREKGYMPIVVLAKVIDNRRKKLCHVTQVLHGSFQEELVTLF